MSLLIAAFVAGILTVLAPCVLPLLPVIIGGSVSGDAASRRRPLVITLSLAVSLILFTVLLKATTLLISIPPTVLTEISGGIIAILGVIILFPAVYQMAMVRLGIEGAAQQALVKGSTSRSSLVGPILIGAALGPVFSSCSPVYAYILATVLPVRFGLAMLYIVAYVVGLSLALLLIARFGQRLVKRIKFASNPRGWFQRTLGVIFLVVGLMIVTGYDKKFQVWVADHTAFNFDGISASLLPSSGPEISAETLNVTPYAAPEFKGISQWINSSPLTLAGLKGKVALVDFWTYSCINCIRNNPYLDSWYAQYKDAGLVVVGVHAPEFAFEKVPANVQKAVKDQNIAYPVALDNDFSTWNAYGNRYWPAGYLIDATGKVRRVHYGEGDYAQTEQAIRALLEESGAHLDAKTATTGTEAVPITSAQTPETYLGSDKASDYVGAPALGAASASTFVPESSLASNEWTLGGAWQVLSDKIVAQSDSTLQFKVAAKDVYLVAGSAAEQSMQVLVDGVSVSTQAGRDVHDGAVSVSDSRLYHLVSFPAFTQGHVLTLRVPAGVSLNAFTFGS